MHVYLLKNEYGSSQCNGIGIGYWYYQDPLILGIGWLAWYHSSPIQLSLFHTGMHTVYSGITCW